ncbi:hypothetical protein APA_1429 [Pseudanabaena sp. lw0831]|nr:hypothetical protein APA_1429 [Pseudanabaena sp. lw0831]
MSCDHQAIAKLTTLLRIDGKNQNFLRSSLGIRLVRKICFSPITKSLNYSLSLATPTTAFNPQICHIRLLVSLSLRQLSPM